MSEQTAGLGWAPPRPKVALGALSVAFDSAVVTDGDGDKIAVITIHTPMGMQHYVLPGDFVLEHFKPFVERLFEELESTMPNLTVVKSPLIVPGQ